MTFPRLFTALGQAALAGWMVHFGNNGFAVFFGLVALIDAIDATHRSGNDR